MELSTKDTEKDCRRSQKKVTASRLWIELYICKESKKAPQKAEQSYPIIIVYLLQAHDQQVPPEVEQRRKDDIFGFDEGKAEHEAEKNYWKEGAAGHIADEAAVEDPSGEVDHKEHQAVEEEGLPHFILFVYWVQQPATEHDLLIKAHEQVHRHQQRS